MTYFTVRREARSTSAHGLGCVKTPKLNLRIEISSRLHQFEKQKRWRPLWGEDNRENNSAPSSRADVFTQPRPFATCGPDTVVGRFRGEADLGSSFARRAHLLVQPLANPADAAPQFGSDRRNSGHATAIAKPTQTTHDVISRPSIEAVQKVYSITSPARTSSDGGTLRPSALAALRLITSSYLVGACTGRSAGFSPLRMRST